MYYQTSIRNVALSCSFLLNLFLYDDIQKYINNPKYKAIEKW